MSVYVLEPLDTQFHRSTLPFDAGEDIETSTRQIPWPRTVYGALRSAGFVKAGIGFARNGPVHAHPVWGSATEPAKFSIKGPFVYLEDKGGCRILLPAPADLLYQDVKQGKCLRYCIPDTNRQMRDFSDCGQSFGSLRPLRVDGYTPRKKFEKLERRFLSTGKDLSNYLSQKLQNRALQKYDRSFPLVEEVFVTERRVGITRSHLLHTAGEGLLYSVPHSRCITRVGDMDQRIGFWLELNSPDSPNPLPNSGVLRLGGESRPAGYRLLSDDEPEAASRWPHAFRDNVIETIAREGRFKLYLISPGLFGGRGHPFVEKENEIVFSFDAEGNPVTARLVGMALTEKDLIGGWDMVGSFPKPLETAVAPGTVYFFEVPGWPKESEEATRRASAIFDALNFKSLCGADSSSGLTQREGFGIVLTGGWYVR